ncbi:MAG: hypothetical protein JWM56_933 [Candidatus Peribacteria bacterium]|nr:hypothetical protein [Candidatus Peribacteria bacterium]
MIIYWQVFLMVAFVALSGFAAFTYFTATRNDAAIGAASVLLAVLILIFLFPLSVNDTSPEAFKFIKDNFGFFSIGGIIVVILAILAWVFSAIEAADATVASSRLPTRPATAGRDTALLITSIVIIIVGILTVVAMIRGTVVFKQRTGWGLLADTVYSANSKIQGEKYVITEDPLSLETPRSLLSTEEQNYWKGQLESIKESGTDAQLKDATINHIELVHYDVRQNATGDPTLIGYVVFEFSCGEEKKISMRKFEIEIPLNEFITIQIDSVKSTEFAGRGKSVAPGGFVRSPLKAKPDIGPAAIRVPK